VPSSGDNLNSLNNMANVMVVAHHTRSEVPPLFAVLRTKLSAGGRHLWMCEGDA